ncbi:STAS domain-containing protein [Umezawaea sp.]|uniref:STAS domain-containing protein n=1 Tax=Umezawaea sp. TaxID=1955258 RepID=UPI002ED2EDE5
MDDEALTVSSEKLDNALVVHIVGEVDLDTVDLMDTALAEAAATVTAPEIVVADLTDVTFFDSMGISSLLTARQRCQEHRVSLVVVASDRRVLRPIKLTDLDRVFTVVGAVEEAVRSDVA